MLLVKSANDIAVVLAENIGGSVEGFSAKMNAAAERLGMTDSHFENPNGLPNAAHHSSAQDLAILGRALLTEFPDSRGYFGIGAIALGNHVYRTFNGLLGRYPGADGMKTGFICAGGFNTVVSVTHGGRRLIAVVLGQPSASVRSVVTASLLDKAFASSNWGSWTKVTALQRVGGEAPDMRGEICGRRGKRRAVTWEQEVDTGSAPCAPGAPAGVAGGNPALETLLPSAGGGGSCGDTASGKSPSPNSPVAFDPVPVFTGPSAASAAALPAPATLAVAGAAGKTAAFAPGAEEEAIPGKVKANGKPVRLRGKRAGKAALARARRGAKVAAKPADGDASPAAPKKGKGAASPVKRKSAAKPKAKEKGG
jgi:D-alanyl-D-alanine carboxypeptidase